LTEELYTVGEDTPVEDIVQVMEKHRIKRLPVVRGDRCVGIVGCANLIQALAGLVGESRVAAGDDGAIRAHVLAEIDGQPWAAPACVNIIVRSGVAHLRGTIFDQREPQALRVAAENAPGVTGVQDHLVCIEPLSGTVLLGQDDQAVVDSAHR
jgi:hypothetical protein